MATEPDLELLAAGIAEDRRRREHEDAERCARIDKILRDTALALLYDRARRDEQRTVTEAKQGGPGARTREHAVTFYRSRGRALMDVMCVLTGERAGSLYEHVHHVLDGLDVSQREELLWQLRGGFHRDDVIGEDPEGRRS